MARPRPVRPLRRPLQPDALHPALPFRLRMTLDDLEALRTWGSVTPGHPEVRHTVGVETTTGPLGQGVGNAVGMAMAARRTVACSTPTPPAARASSTTRSGASHPTVTCRRACPARRPRWPAPRAGQPRRDLGRQPDLHRGRHQTSPSRRTSPARYEAYGWHVQNVDWRRRATAYREDVAALHAALAGRPGRDQPAVVRRAPHRSSRWPAPTKQNTGTAHGSALGADEVAATKRILGFDPERTFVVGRRRPGPRA